jgi:hypothetical protein
MSSLCSAPSTRWPPIHRSRRAPQTPLNASTERYAIGLAIAPIDNFVTEFLPGVARHVHIQVVIIQRVINQAARTDNTAQ